MSFAVQKSVGMVWYAQNISTEEQARDAYERAISQWHGHPTPVDIILIDETMGQVIDRAIVGGPRRVDDPNQTKLAAGRDR